MNNMTTEEKAKRYDEAIERAKQWRNAPNVDKIPTFANRVIEEIFPELKESEDERIRKELIEFVKNSCFVRTKDSKYNREQMLAWLEKQGKQKPAKIEPKFKVGQTIKKEGFNLGFTIAKIEDDFYYNDMGDYFPFTDQDNWEFVEQKPEWSEEDEKMRTRCAACLGYHYHDELITKKEYKEAHNWLDSLKGRVQPQTTWKPSDEQMGALWDSIKHNLHLHPILKSLYNDLKKLREE